MRATLQTSSEDAHWWSGIRQTCAHWRLALCIDLVEEPVTRDTAVTRERVHHPTVGGNREGAAEEHGSNDDDLGDMGQSAIVGRGVLTHH